MDTVSVRTIAVMVVKIATMGVMKMTAVGITINGLCMPKYEIHGLAL